MMRFFHENNLDVCQKYVRMNDICDRVDRSHVIDILSDLERVQNWSTPIYKTCAVVGAAGGLLREEKGAMIDAHDAVIRINLSPVSGFARHVGRRTTWRVLTLDKFDYHPLYRMLTRNGPATSTPDNRWAIACYGPFRGRCTLRRFRQLLAANRGIYIISPTTLLRTKRRLRSSKLTGRNAPTTGLVAIDFALSTCEHVSIFGFAHMPCRDTCYHYYECSHPESNIFNGTNNNH